MAHAFPRGTELRDAGVELPLARSREMRSSSVRAQRKRQSEGYGEWGQHFATFHLALGHWPWLRRMLARNSLFSLQSLEISRKF
eukprot:scaffold76395_cov27-Phaeocystis_antarctica.AAC.1